MCVSSGSGQLNKFRVQGNPGKMVYYCYSESNWTGWLLCGVTLRFTTMATIREEGFRQIFRLSFPVSSWRNGICPLAPTGAEKPKPYLDPKEPTFLGFLSIVSLYKSLKR